MAPSDVSTRATATPSSRVRTAEESRKAASLEVDASRAKFLPTIAVAADYGMSGQYLTKDGIWTGQVGVFAEWSIWDGGGDDSKLAQARERLRQATISSSEAQRHSGIDLDETVRLVDQAREQLALAAKQSSLADSQLVLSRERFQEGASGNLEVVQAQAERNTAHAAWIEAAGAYRAALVRRGWATGHWDGF
jgi:outer membrane protein TolC